MILVEETDKRFYLAPSRLPDGGTGVFAAVPLKKGEWMEIVGVMVECAAVANRCTAYAHDYKFASRIKDNDRYIVPMGFAGMVNHAVNGVGMNMKLEYLRGVTPKNPNAGSAVLMVTRDVAKDEELLHHYGADWDKRLGWQAEAAAALEAEEWNKFAKHDLYGLGCFAT
jgi:hypothetical protein